MKNNTNIDENIEGAKNSIAWKYIVMLILEEHDLEGYIKEEVKEPEGDGEKSKHPQRIIQRKCLMH